MAESTLSSSPPAEPARPSTAPPLEYGRARKGLPGSEKVLEILKTLAWVAPLTILIWIYAEREESRTAPDVSFSIEVRTTDNSRIVTLQEPADHNVIATLTGPRTAVDRMINELRAGKPDQAAVRILIDPKLPKGENTLESSRYIANLPMFIRQGVSVPKISPGNLRVNIDDFETRDLDVKPNQDLPNVQFIPSKVAVRAPSQVFEKADRNRLYVVADLSKQDLSQPGVHDLHGVPVQPAFAGDQITVEQPTVNASVEIKKQLAMGMIPSVAVWESIAPKLADKYKIRLDNPTIANVQVTGPQKMIDQINNGDYRVIAHLDVTDADEQYIGKERSKAVTFTNLPEGVKVAHPEQYTVTYTLVDRASE
jgi:hypothetical protein